MDKIDFKKISKEELIEHLDDKVFYWIHDLFEELENNDQLPEKIQQIIKKIKLDGRPMCVVDEGVESIYVNCVLDDKHKCGAWEGTKGDCEYWRPLSLEESVIALIKEQIKL
jgi:hypothetical protein